MKFKNIDLKDLRKRYADSDEFCIKIREKENDIVYYNGIKAFEIQHDKKENYEIKMPDNIYNFNKTNMKENNNILEGITELRKNMSKYFLKSIHCKDSSFLCTI